MESSAKKSMTIDNPSDRKQPRPSIDNFPGLYDADIDNLETIRTDKIVSPGTTKKMNQQNSSSKLSIKKKRKESLNNRDED